SHFHHLFIKSINLRFLCLQYSDHHRDLYSFPTRRSSDLPRLLQLIHRLSLLERSQYSMDYASLENKNFLSWNPLQIHPCLICPRSEEHTSELQSRFDLVCRILLEKNTIISSAGSKISKRQ